MTPISMTPKELLKNVRQGLSHYGWRVSDPAYGSAAGWGAFIALRDFNKSKGTLFDLALTVALRDCRRELHKRLTGFIQFPEDDLGRGILAKAQNDALNWDADDVLALVDSIGENAASRLFGIQKKRLHELIENVIRWRPYYEPEREETR